MVEIITAFAVKMKAYLIAIAVGYVASTVRYVEHKRKLISGKLKKEVKVITLLDWFLFGVMASVITMTGVALIEYLGYEFTTPMILLIFWFGYLTDYLFQWIPIFLKTKFEKLSKKDNDGH